jgi:ferrochelatase
MAKHVVLVAHGEPTTPNFVDHLVYSWRLMQGVARSTADHPAVLLPWLAYSRARERTSLWRKYGYRSPLEPITLAQAAQLRHALALVSQETWKIHVAYEFREPFLLDAIKRRSRRETVIVVPMYAADSGFNHELSRQSAGFLDKRRPAPIIVLRPLDVERLAEISADHVMQSIAMRAEPAPQTALVLAARGSLLKPSKEIETGRVTLERLGEAITRRMTGHFGMVATGWLNYGRGDTWTAPPIRETFRRVSEAGFQQVVYYPYGFLADNTESQLFGQLSAASRPELEVRFLPCLNGSPELAKAIARDIIAAR